MPATRRPNLRAVAPGEKPAPQRRTRKKVPTILEAAEAGDRLAELVAMRRRLAKALDDPNCPPRDMAALSRRQLEIGREIDALKAAAEQEAAEDAEVADEDFDASAI
jgi:hypothetical protein